MYDSESYIYFKTKSIAALIFLKQDSFYSENFKSLRI